MRVNCGNEKSIGISPMAETMVVWYMVIQQAKIFTQPVKELDGNVSIGYVALHHSLSPRPNEPGNEAIFISKDAESAYTHATL